MYQKRRKAVERPLDIPTVDRTATNQLTGGFVLYRLLLAVGIVRSSGFANANEHFYRNYNSRNNLASSRKAFRVQPLSAFFDIRNLPLFVFGPVDFCHGFQLRISAACCSRSSDVHCRMALLR